MTVAVYVPFWYSREGSSEVLAHRRTVGEVSPWIYGLSPEGAIAPQYAPQDAETVSADLARLRAAGLPLVPGLANVTEDEFSHQPISGILADPARRAAHVAEIAELVTREDYAGIDIDYEELLSTDREAFTALVAELSAALHPNRRRLSVALFAKDSDAGYDERNLAQDYAAIGAAADEVRLMAYDYHWPGSPPGPLAPIGWVRDVLAYATTRVEPDTILLGVGLYGYDWSGGHGSPISWRQAADLAATHDAAVRLEAESHAPTFSYTDASGNGHEVWFENAASARAKVRAAFSAGIGGVFFWMPGKPDPDIWPALSDELDTGILGGGR
jgi:spore germination protein YaaH